MATDLWEVNPIAAYPPARAGSRVRTRDPERRKRILAATADLVARKGFHAVSVYAAEMPPLMLIACPVSRAAAGLAKKTAKPAMSSAVGTPS